MNKKCARCEKTVYPIEELKCLDKVWHKLCFKCQECGMVLNMRNYKGFDRLPYCSAHCPQAKHTTVADTPEIRRMQENTKLQSSIKYHEEFEKQKGKLTQVADDPETLRIKQNTKIISNVAYHGDLERKAAMEQRRPPGEDNNGVDDYEEGETFSHTQLDELTKSHRPDSNGNRHAEPAARGAANSKSTLPSKLKEQDQFLKASPYSGRQASTVIYTSEHGSVTAPPTRKVGSIADYDPVNENYGSIASGYRLSGSGDVHAGYPLAQAMPPQQYVTPQPVIQQHVIPKQQSTFRAMYDYTAADSDEVSFLDGDVIINCQPIDDGWMTGCVQRTGQTGMLPANYVEPLN